MLYSINIYIGMSNYLIVGASSGIGQSLAGQLVGAQTIKFTQRITKTKLNRETILIEYHYLNVMDETISTDFLPETLDGLVYCPGSINLRLFERIKPMDFVNDFNLQVTGAVKVIQAVLPKLKKSGNASVILFSTVAVQSGLPFHSQVAVSKGAIEGLTRALAAELAPGIRVNCIAPSLTDTPLASSLLNTEQKREAECSKTSAKKIWKA